MIERDLAALGVVVPGIRLGRVLLGVEPADPQLLAALVDVLALSQDSGRVQYWQDSKLLLNNVVNDSGQIVTNTNLSALRDHCGLYSVHSGSDRTHGDRRLLCQEGLGVTHYG